MSGYGKVIRSLRKEKRMTMKELGRQIDVAESTVSMYEREERTPSPEKFEMIADVFNVDMDYLYGRTTVRRKVDLEGFIANTISSDEVELIKAFRKSPPSTQKAIRIMIGIEK